MQNILLAWFASNKEWLAQSGFKIKLNDAPQVRSTSVNMDSDLFVGTITYWAIDQFEFQFNACSNGEVVVLNTVTLGTEEALGKYIREELLPSLINVD